ncbi:MAG: rhamnulokinase [Atopobiaceae bacterium]|jgi:rhamnulokinase|nr:rhamnulokinase [Atopobiaceae bacterium]
MKTCRLAVDIGASSGRVIAGTFDGNRYELSEVHRFENGAHVERGHLCWDVEGLVDNVISGLRAAGEAGWSPSSIAIDTWGCDFVLVDRCGERLGDCVSYRDARTKGMPELLDRAIGPDGLYARCGIQLQPFNTVYQLMALAREHPEQLRRAGRLLMVPDYLNYRLTEVMSNEYTNATTTSLVNARTCAWDLDVIDAAGLPRSLFGPLSLPGSRLGSLSPEVAREVGFDCAVILPATHDTGSAFLAAPVADEHAAILSSGTWSLVGRELAEPVTTEASRIANLTNEGGYQRRYRYLKNIMGLWMTQSVRRELADGNGVMPSFGELASQAAAAEGFSSVVDAEDRRFLAPTSMSEEIRRACAESGQRVPSTTGELLRCVDLSLAADYACSLDELGGLTGDAVTSLNIVGGGSQDQLLNQLTADACGLPVSVGPVEGTALGNLIVQLVAAGEIPDLAAARKAIRRSFDIKEVLPR